MRGRNIGLLLASAALSVSCATVELPPGYVAELDAREMPNARFAAAVGLLDEVPGRIVGTMARDGRAHIWAIDKGKTLHHVEVDEQGGVVRERLGSVDGDLRTLPFDAVEERSGALRVLVGSSQFIRSADGSTWRESKRNECVRFVVALGRLFCGFVMSGEQLGAARRTDWYTGIVLIVPFAIPVDRQSRKLVLAEPFGEAWVVRAVVDLADLHDAETRFLMVADDQGDIQIVYAASRGGAVILITGGGIGGSELEPERPRYARLTAASLARGAAAGPPAVPASPVAVVSRPMTITPWREYPYGMDWRILTEAFAIDPSSGEIEGLMPWSHNAKVRFRSTEARLDGVFDAVLRDGIWLEPRDFVLVNDWPSKDFEYTFMDHLGQGASSVSFDMSGQFHALVSHCTSSSTWQPCRTALSYLVKSDGRWSRPLTLVVPLDRQNHQRRALLLVGAGRVFVAWAESGVGMRGSWILPLGTADARPAPGSQR